MSQTAEYGDNIDKMSQKMGLSAEAYQEWDAIMQHSGTSIDSLQAGMKTLANAVESGNDAFERLGITQEDISSMDNEELFSATISALQNVDNETERTYLAGQLLGRGATELGALLNMSAEETEEMRQRVHELGGVMSDEAVKSAAAYQDSLQDMKTAFSGLSRGMMSEFLPSVTSVMDGITEIFAGNGDSGIALISSGISDFVDNINTVMPQIMEQGKQILSVLIKAITENLPDLINMGMQAIGMLVDGIMKAIPNLSKSAIKIVKTLISGLVDAIPDIASAAIEMIQALASGIGEALPELTPAVVGMVMQIVEILTNPETLVGLLDAALQIMVGLAEGLINAIPVLIEALPTIIENLITALIAAYPMLTQAGIDLFVSLVSNLPAIIAGIVQAIPEIILAILGGLSSLPGMMAEIFVNAWEGIKEIFSNVGEWFNEKFGEAWQGIKEAFAGVGNFFSGIWSSITSVFSNVAGWFKEKFTAAWTAVKNVFSTGGKIFDGIKDGILSGLKTVVNGIITGINKVIAIPFNGINAALNKIRSVSILGAHPFSWISTISVPQIPKLAEGAVIQPNKEFLAILGDQKRGVNVEAPLQTIKDALKEAISEIGFVPFSSSGIGISSSSIVNRVSEVETVGSSGPLTINLMFPDGTKLASYLLNDLFNVSRANGTPIYTPT